MTSEKLNPGKRADDALTEEIRQVALRLLARREHSLLELQHKLTRRGFPSPLIETVLTQLAAENLLSEARFAEIYACSRVDKGYGPLRIHRELHERGVSQSIIAAILRDLDDLWMQNLVQVHRKRFGEVLPITLAERAERTRFLRHRGFTLEQIKRLFRGARGDAF